MKRATDNDPERVTRTQNAAGSTGPLALPPGG